MLFFEVFTVINNNDAANSSNKKYTELRYSGVDFIELYVVI